MASSCPNLVPTLLQHTMPVTNTTYSPVTGKEFTITLPDKDSDNADAATDRWGLFKVILYTMGDDTLDGWTVSLFKNFNEFVRNLWGGFPNFNQSNARKNCFSLLIGCNLGPILKNIPLYRFMIHLPGGHQLGQCTYNNFFFLLLFKELTRHV